MRTLHAPGSVEHNIGVAFSLARAILNDPSLLQEIPDGAVVIPLPDDDPRQRQDHTRRAEVAHERTAAVVRLDVPRDLERGECLPKRWPAHLTLFGQVSLGRQPLSRVDPSPSDQLTDLNDGLLRKPGALDRLDPKLVAHHRFTWFIGQTIGPGFRFRRRSRGCQQPELEMVSHNVLHPRLTGASGGRAGGKPPR